MKKSKLTYGTVSNLAINIFLIAFFVKKISLTSTNQYDEWHAGSSKTICHENQITYITGWIKANGANYAISYRYEIGNSPWVTDTNIFNLGRGELFHAYYNSWHAISIEFTYDLSMNYCKATKMKRYGNFVSTWDLVSKPWNE